MRETESHYCLHVSNLQKACYEAQLANLLRKLKNTNDIPTKQRTGKRYVCVRERESGEGGGIDNEINKTFLHFIEDSIVILSYYPSSPDHNSHQYSPILFPH